MNRGSWIKNNWFRIAFFMLTALFWGSFYRRDSATMLVLAIFSSFLSLWMIIQRVRE